MMILADIPGTDRRSVNRSTRPLWALAGVVFILVGAGLFLTRQRPMTASAIVAQASANLEKVSSYHVKYKSVARDPGGQESIVYSEYWYQSPASWKREMSGSEFQVTEVIDGNVRWFYRKGSGIAVKIPLSDSERDANIAAVTLTGSTRDALDRLGEGYDYSGTRKLGDRECDVIKGDFPEGRHVEFCIDRATGIMLQYIETGQDELYIKEEIVTFNVNTPIPKDVFALDLPRKTLVIKSPEMTPGWAMLDLEKVNTILGDGSFENPFTESDLQRLATQGAAKGARLKRVYQPVHIPHGYKMVSAGSYGEERRMPDGTTSISHTGGYSEVYVDYVNPHTGNAITLTESADKFDKHEGREVSQDGFRGRIASYQKPFPYVILHWESDGVHFRLSASSMSEREVVEIAKSMLPLSVISQEAPTGKETRPRITAGKLEFRHLRSVKDERHSDAKYTMDIEPGEDGEEVYRFTDSTGKTVDSKLVVSESPIILTGADVLPSAECTADSYLGGPNITIQFSREGTKKFADFTKAHIGEYLAIVVDGRILSAPRISGLILDGRAVIQGSKNVDEAKRLTDILNGK